MLYQGSNFENQYLLEPSSQLEPMCKEGLAARINKQSLEILSARPAKQMRRLVLINLGSGKRRSLTGHFGNGIVREKCHWKAHKPVSHVHCLDF